LKHQTQYSHKLEREKMKYIQLATLLVALCINNSYANQCSPNQPQNNQLIKSIQSFSDTSPFFKSNKLYSYKANSWDIDIDDYSINKYDNKLKLTGNTWKMLRLDTSYTLTPNSVLEFEFKSIGDEAEINGIGLVMHGASGFNGSRFFQVHGTQVASTYNQDYHNYVRQ